MKHCFCEKLMFAGTSYLRSRILY